jgi:hypothetical protein
MFKITLKKSTPQSVAPTIRASADSAPHAHEELLRQTSSSAVTSMSSSRRHSTSHRFSSGSTSSITSHIPPASTAAIHSLIHLRLRAQARESLREICPNDECVICAEVFSNKDVVTTLPCGHMHHYNCIIDWLSRKCTCPTCRYEMPTDDKNFERRRKRRQAEHVTPNQIAATTTAPTTIAATTPERHFSLSDMMYVKRSAYVACQDHANLNVIVRRTLRIKQDIERKRAVLAANRNGDDKETENSRNPSAFHDYAIPVDIPIDHAHFLELHA